MVICAPANLDGPVPIVKLRSAHALIILVGIMEFVSKMVLGLSAIAEQGLKVDEM